MKKGQVGLEYLIVTTFLLVATGLVFIFSAITLDESLKFFKADKALSKLATAADKASSRGPNNEIYVDIELPEEIQSNQINIFNKTIYLTLITSSGLNERHVTTKAVLTPTTLLVEKSFNTIKVELVDANVVFTEV